MVRQAITQRTLTVGQGLKHTVQVNVQMHNLGSSVLVHIDANEPFPCHINKMLYHPLWSKDQVM